MGQIAKDKPHQSLYGLVMLLLITVYPSIKCIGQVPVTWDNIPIPTTTGATGTFPLGGIVTLVPIGAGNTLDFSNMPDLTNLFVEGPWWNAPSQDLQFTFNRPVVITRLEVEDVNSSVGQWNDSFNLSPNTSFNNVAPLVPGVTTAGVLVGAPNAVNIGTVSWTCSAPLTQFTINFLNPLGVTTAWLRYRITVIDAPEIFPLCANSVPPELPDVNGIDGTWSPSVIDTSVSGDFTYTFTPDPDLLLCPILMIVTILEPNDPNCCAPDLTLVNPMHNVDNTFANEDKLREAENWIVASNTVAVGDNVYQNGVVYHAGDFVELIPGFEAAYGAQFATYIERCTANYAYRQGPSVASPFPVPKDKVGEDVAHMPSDFNVFPNPSSGSITVRNNVSLKWVSLMSIEGKIMLEATTNAKVHELDVSSFQPGIYILSAETHSGQLLQTKFIKN